MCGIAGIISERKGCREAIAEMLALMSHRGPDGSGIWSARLRGENTLVLGHRRLSIIDLTERAAQPMATADGWCAVSFNGEIYNYIEIRKELEQDGIHFTTNSDTEVLLEAYSRWGTECLDRLNGMFAFGLYDRRKRQLFCARDRYGEKPFLFVLKPETFAFASEYKALLACPGVSPEVEELRLIQAAYNASSGMDADRQTVFRDIQQLLPGEALLLDADTLDARIWRYWDVTPDPDLADLPEAEIFSRFGDLLRDSVRLRMRADVPVGSCLSGGLDSSAIVCLARRFLGQDAPYHTFTGRFPGTEADEWAYASGVIQQTGVISHVVEPTAEGFAAELQEFLWYNELPVGSSSQYAQYCVFRLAKEHGVTVLMDGQGADELLGGYEQYFQSYVTALRASGETVRLNRELPEIWKRYPLALNPPARTLRDRIPFALRRWAAHRMGKGTSLLFGLKPEVAQALGKEGVFAREGRFNALTSMLYQESFGRYLTTLLRYGDRNSMAHSREVRLPFCDHRLANFVFSLPPHLLMGEVQTKRLLRASMRGILPEAVRTRWNKQGFRPPQTTWFKGRLLALAEEAFHDPVFVRSPYWDARWWQRALVRMKAGETQLAWPIWNPFVIEMWRRHFLGRATVQSKGATRETVST